MNKPTTNLELDQIVVERETGAAILSEVEGFVRRFVVHPSEHARVAHVLWLAHTHNMEAFYTTPRLAFMSEEKESGKTRALEVSELLVPTAILSISISPAALVRRVAEGGVVAILYDEIDALFGTKAREEASLDVRSILNGGYRRGAKVHRCVNVGKRIEVEELNAFAPVALAGLRELPDTLASRSIIIRMRRRAPDEAVEPWRERHVRPQAEDIQRRLAAWVSATEMPDEPEMPAGVVDRAEECWEPLLAVADAAGGEWPARARAAAVYLVAGAVDESRSPGVELLEHIREAFGDNPSLSTERLLSRLHERDESPWKDIRGKPLGDRGLAGRLKGFGIRSRVIRIGSTTPRGYRREDFADAWARYLLPQAQQAQHVQQLSSCNDLTVADVADVALRMTSATSTCDYCGQPETAGGRLLEVHLGDRHARLHRGCEEGWLAAAP